MTSEIRYLAQQLLHAGLAPLSERDARVIARVARRVHTARDVNKVFDQRLTMGQRLADQVAVVGGSWGFIVGFGVFLAIWVAINVVVFVGQAFDLSVRVPQPAPVYARGPAGAHHHDEPEPAG